MEENVERRQDGSSCTFLKIRIRSSVAGLDGKTTS